MRLLDARTLQFKEVQGLQSMPKYAILSHTWADKEVVYADLVSSPQLAHQRPEFTKVKFAAHQAINDGLDYVWIDTCNIDKSSSAELSETINSMYMLYKRAEVCYAYLVDVLEPPPVGWDDNGHNDDAWTKELANSRWFTRGWTLQELLAPRNVVFYSSDWRRIGTKRELCQTIARNIGISSTILLGSDHGRTLVAERMSWAAKRKTTRVEDQAYCLLGLFDINMPLLYGEGERAFLRLQHEIIKKTNDRSIFLWYNLPARYGRFELTQSGLEISMPLIEVPGARGPEFFGVVVDDHQGFHCVCLRQIGDHEYLRVDAHETFPILNPDYNPFATKKARLRPQWITIPNTFEHYRSDSHMDYRLGGFCVEYYPIELEISNVEPSHAWHAETDTLEMDFSQSASMEAFEEDGTGLKITFRETAHPDTTFDVDIIDQMRTRGWKMYESSTKKYGYLLGMTQRFVGDKLMNVIRVDYQIHEEGGWKISSEKNPLPGRYKSYRNPSKEELAKMIETWDQERGEENGKGVESARGIENGSPRPDHREVVDVTDEIEDTAHEAESSSDGKQPPT